MLTITDLTPHYTEHITTQHRPEAYCSLYPALFRHYFAFWGDRDRPWARLDNDTLRDRTVMIRRRLATLEERFIAFGLQLDDIPILLFVGQGVGHGHVFVDNGQPVVWLPVEAFETDLAVDILGAHEILHAAHFRRCPEFSFSTFEEMHRVSRRFVTEGIVTFLSQKLLGVDDVTTLWADRINNQDAAEWMVTCRKNDEKIRGLIDERWDDSVPEWGPLHAREKHEIFNYRCGYYIALKVMQEIAAMRAGDPLGLLNVNRRLLEKLAREHLHPGRRHRKTA